MALPLPTALQHGNLVLRLPTRADTDAVVAACQDPEIPRWTRVPSPYGVAEAHTWFELAEAERAAGDGLHLLITERATLLGSVGIVGLDWPGGVAEVGYWVSAEARGRGVARRALEIVAAWGLQQGFRRLFADVIVGNDASERVLEKVGFQREGVQRSMPAGSCGTDPAARIDIAVWSLVQGDEAASRLAALPVAAA
jgi:RimJ/RimL family protein N-acetyltransferase